MVHALGEIHRVLAPGGTVVDARPDSRLPAYAEHGRGRGYEIFGVVNTVKVEMASDAAADAAMRKVVHEGLFNRRRRGRFWHRVPFDDLAELRRYLREHQRFVPRAKWSVDQATLRRHANDPFAIRRPVQYNVLEAVDPR